ncbi:putative DNA polymerase zeta catalytic subunit [Viridothelium virens]|uniref:DNA polymerase n=1 Tax=Viridothelium virens TaxID=1048519 RepID=A0A6A6GWH0_VIRVR|nr:putative DNA polymerase zeta catalytic subunit [Viridothelium virens]
MDLFRVRLNCVDHYQAVPTDLDPNIGGHSSSSQRRNAPHVPVIRVFGATETGQKVCAHIHGVLPYLYLKYDGELSGENIRAYIHNLRISIDHALAVSYRRNPYDGKAVFVAHITLIKGVPYYGYSVGYQHFLKVYLLNPLNMTRLADLLYQGAIMKRVFQPYESHLQYLLQWMCDYNLYGCAYIDCDKPRFRSPVPEYLELNSSAHKWHDRSIPTELIEDSDQFARQSHCSIEVDICVQDIVNRREIKPRPLHHDFIERFNYLTDDEKLVQSMAGLWRDETKRRKRRMGLKDPSSSPFPPEVLISMSADPRDTSKGGWIHEEEYRAMIKDLAKDERQKSGGNKISFEDFVRPETANIRIQTALESVEDLFTENLCKTGQTDYLDLPKDIDDEGRDAPILSAALVDETTVSRFNSDDFYHDSDEETARRLALSRHTDAAKGMTSGSSDSETSQLDGAIRPFGVDNGKTSGSLKDRLQVPPTPKSLSTQQRQRASLQGHRAGQFDGQAFDLVREYGEHIEHDAGFFEEPKQSSRSAKRQKTSRSPGHTVSQSGNTREDIQISEDSIEAQPSASAERPKPGLEFDDYVDSDSSSNLLQHVPEASSQREKNVQINGNLNKLSFPVVKNPHHPDTALRLSQRSGHTGSQKSAEPSSQNISSLGLSSSSAAKQTGSGRSPAKSSSSSADYPSHRLQLPLACLIHNNFQPSRNVYMYYFNQRPPSAQMVESTMKQCGRPPIIYQDAYYSNERDVPERSREYAGREFKLESTTLPYLPEFDPAGRTLAVFGEKVPIVVDRAKEKRQNNLRRAKCTIRNWEIAAPPPSQREVRSWLDVEQERKRLADGLRTGTDQAAPNLSQIDGPTQKNKHGFKYSQKHQSTSVQHETQYMSTMSLEVHVNSRGTLAPDPAEDEINCIFWSIRSDDEEITDSNNNEGIRIGAIVLSTDDKDIAHKIERQTGAEVHAEDDELDLINKLIDIVRDFDPDILTGFEVHNGSWGYLIERARLKYEYDLPDELSRMKSQSHGRFGKDADRWGFTHTSTIRITGRHMINIWRAMRSELNLLQYTMENVVFHLLQTRIPHYSFYDLTKWYTSSSVHDLTKVIAYFIDRVQLDLRILEANELIPRTSEQARLLGVDFFSVFSRGSQFKVESLMFRIAKPENFILVSPSRKQVGQQNALECLPLVMEPQSAFYNSPLLVLDFQSLYPSVMIAYNYCYSTCLGRITSWRGANKMGFMDFEREPRLLELVKDHINIAPNGMMYVKPTMRKSLLAKMLGEILETRVMVKSGMKVDKDDRTLQQLLNNRQLALKLIANVTYGYTSASFSGRMPCAEIADSIVQTGRETLEKAIALIHSVSRWDAEVVYGDTDSLFVYLKGRTRAQAFQIGNEIADAVTKQNPRPVKLKFEKVYHPCVLLAKKRYVGFKYESPTQAEPEFDAKGIETVRRDGTPAEQKIEEKALKLLFRTSDLSQVKAYFQDQCTKIMRGKVSVQDFCFAKEVKLGTYSERGPPPPGALIATKKMLADHRAEPQYGERILYVVAAGAPGARLIDRCVAPEVLLADEEMELDAEYYISKNLIPPLERIFNLVGANVRQWYDEMPKVQRVRAFGAGGGQEDGVGRGLFGHAPGRKTLERYLQKSVCLVCRTKLAPPKSLAEDKELPLCADCRKRPSRAILALRTKLSTAEKKVADVERVCRSCANLSWNDEVKCDSRDCPVFYSRIRAKTKEGVEKAGIGEIVGTLEYAEGRKSVLEW